VRTLIYGAGAIGGYVGGLLAKAGNDVTLLARGAQAAALERDGLSIEWPDGRKLEVKTPVLLPGAQSAPFDTIFVTLKSMQLADAATDIARLLAPGGSLVMIQNGLPWWYFERLDSPFAGARLKSLDPDGRLAQVFDLDRVIGAVIYKPVMLTGPGRLFIPKVPLDRLIIGELDGRASERANDVAAAVTAAGMPTEITGDIRLEKWQKLGGNMVWNPLCALTQSTSGYIAASPAGADLVRRMMAEGKAVAASIGVAIELDAETELARIKTNFTQQPSMMQDIRAGRPLELGAILEVVIEIAALTGVAVPTLANIAACVDLLDRRVREDRIGIAPRPA